MFTSFIEMQKRSIKVVTNNTAFDYKSETKGMNYTVKRCVVKYTHTHDDGDYSCLGSCFNFGGVPFGSCAKCHTLNADYVCDPFFVYQGMATHLLYDRRSGLCEKCFNRERELKRYEPCAHSFPSDEESFSAKCKDGSTRMLTWQERQADASKRMCSFHHEYQC